MAADLKIREHATRSGVPSANTWLIVICLLVFWLDGALVRTPVDMAMRLEADASDGLSAEMVTEGMVLSLEHDRLGPTAGRTEVLLKSTGQPVGTRDILFMHPIERAMHFSVERGFFELQFWRMIGFQFLHSHVSIAHIAINMTVLFLFGPFVEAHLGRRRYVGLYLICGIFGALAVVLASRGVMVAEFLTGLQLAIPGLAPDESTAPLIGASAGVYGVIMARAYIAPDTRVLFLFFLPMRLSVFSWCLVGTTLVLMLGVGQNTGGEVAHLGGAIAGSYLIRRRYPVLTSESQSTDGAIGIEGALSGPDPG